MGSSQEYNGINDHPHWTRDKWRTEIAAGRTDMGYRAWVAFSLEGEGYAQFYGPQAPVRSNGHP